jgi:hypothetical protein
MLSEMKRRYERTLMTLVKDGERRRYWRNEVNMCAGCGPHRVSRVQQRSEKLNSMRTSKKMSDETR